MNKTVTFLKLARVLAPILILLIGVLSLTTVYGLPASDFAGKLIFGFYIIWNAVNKGLLVTGAVEIIFCVAALRVSPKNRPGIFGELLIGEPVGLFWKKLDLWLKLNAIVFVAMGLFVSLSTIYGLVNPPGQMVPTPLFYVRQLLSWLRGIAVQIIWASISLGLGDIIFRLRRAVYRPTQPAA